MRRLTTIGFLFSLILLGTACTSATDTSNNEEKSNSETLIPETRPPFEDIDVLSFQNKMKAENTVVLDVRTPAEIQEGMIEGAITIDIMKSDFEKKLEKLEKDKTYLVYCQSGGRSSRACDMMAKMGFKELYNLEGGYMSWPQ